MVPKDSGKGEWEIKKRTGWRNFVRMLGNFYEYKMKGGDEN